MPAGPCLCGSISIARLMGAGTYSCPQAPNIQHLITTLLSPFKSSCCPCHPPLALGVTTFPSFSPSSWCLSTWALIFLTWPTVYSTWPFQPPPPGLPAQSGMQGSLSPVDFLLSQLSRCLCSRCPLPFCGPLSHGRLPWKPSCTCLIDLTGLFLSPTPAVLQIRTGLGGIQSGTLPSELPPSASLRHQNVHLCIFPSSFRKKKFPVGQKKEWEFTLSGNSLRGITVFEEPFETQY